MSMWKSVRQKKRFQKHLKKIKYTRKQNKKNPRKGHILKLRFKARVFNS